jgi:DNA-binding transcriptional MocR family regulator
MASSAHERVVAELRRQTQALAPGSRLPSVRELSRIHRASPVTVTAAIAVLAAEGLAVARPGRGTFVAEHARPARRPSDYDWQSVALGPAAVDSGGLEQLLARASDPDVIALTSGFPEEALLPVKPLASAIARAGRRPGAWARPPVEGIPELRGWFAREVGGGVGDGDVLVTSGGQAALATILRALGRRGDPILVESPSYIGALAAARGTGLVPVPVPVDRDGVRTDLLAGALRRTGARLMLLQPTFANPHGSTLAAGRRREVLELARSGGAFVIEDDYVRDLWLGRTPPPPPLVTEDRDGHVIYVRSITKATAPSMRIAGVVARGPAGERLRRARIVDDFFVSAVLQHAAVELLASPAFPRHLRQLRRALASRRDALLEALGQWLPEWEVVQRPDGGLCLWVRLPDGADEAAVVQGARGAGVPILPGAPWFPAEPPAPHVRLSYAAAPEGRLAEAARRLAVAQAASGNGASAGAAP